MAELRLKLMQGKIDEQEAAAAAERIEADYAEAYWQSRINKNNYRPVKKAGSSGGGGRKTGGGGGSNGVVWHAIDKDGNVHSYAAKGKDHAHNVAGANGWTLIGSYTETEKEDARGRTTTSTRHTVTDDYREEIAKAKAAAKAKGQGKQLPRKGGNGKKPTGVVWKK